MSRNYEIFKQAIVKGARVWHLRFGFGTIGVLSKTKSVVFVRFDQAFDSWVEIGHIMLEKDVLEDRKKEKQDKTNVSKENPQSSSIG